MNSRVRIVLVLGGVLLAAMLLVPPWKHIFNFTEGQSQRPLGYAPIWAPPPVGSTGRTYGVEIDVVRLSIGCILVVVVTGVGMFLVKDRKPG